MPFQVRFPGRGHLYTHECVHLHIILSAPRRSRTHTHTHTHADRDIHTHTHGKLPSTGHTFFPSRDSHSTPAGGSVRTAIYIDDWPQARFGCIHTLGKIFSWPL